MMHGMDKNVQLCWFLHSIQHHSEMKLKKVGQTSHRQKGAPQEPCRPRYNLHLYGQVGRLQLALPLPTSSRKQQPGGLRTTC